MKTILADLDGVVAATHEQWLNLYNGDYDDDLKVEQITEWAIHKFVKPECGRKIYDYLSRPDFYDGVMPVPGAIQGITTLRRIGHRVIFVSAGFHESKVRWLGRWGLLHEFPYANDTRPSTALDVILANDKSLIRGDYLIDDRPENLETFYGYGLLFSQPWNAQNDWGFRAKSWIQIVDLFS